MPCPISLYLADNSDELVKADGAVTVGVEQLECGFVQRVGHTQVTWNISRAFQYLKFTRASEYLNFTRALEYSNLTRAFKYLNFKREMRYQRSSTKIIMECVYGRWAKM